MTVPATIANPRTGEQVTFVSETPDALLMDVVWTRPGHRASAHVHPAMEERFTVVEGRAAFHVHGRDDLVAGPGETVIVPAGTAHLAWNPTDGPVALRIEMRPALRWAEFTTRFFAGEDPAALLAAYEAEVVLPSR
jgi:mannose-6-phosphate isomerase-like protein (cupin superfamily)